eukprot:10746672-Lingulodinium_polyedra.AAC.1
MLELPARSTAPPFMGLLLDALGESTADPSILSLIARLARSVNQSTAPLAVYCLSLPAMLQGEEDQRVAIA